MPDNLRTEVLEILNNRAALIVIGVLVGGLITGVTNFLLQRSQDQRRFEHEQDMQRQRWEQESAARREQWQKEEEAQKERWAREDEAQESRWNREDRLRNYDERRDAYTALIGATEIATIVRAQISADHNSFTDSVDKAFQANASLRTIAPQTVWYAGHKLVQAFSEYALATYERKVEAEGKAEVLRERQRQFAQLAQIDLGLEDRTSKASQNVYKELLGELRAEQSE